MTIDPRPDIPCRCVVDRLDMHRGGGVWRWEVRVATAPFWHTQIQRRYFIDAPSDTIAAHEGIRRFVEEQKQPAPAIVLTG